MLQPRRSPRFRTSKDALEAATEVPQQATCLGVLTAENPAIDHRSAANTGPEDDHHYIVEAPGCPRGPLA